jgi:hypothetical protein
MSADYETPVMTLTASDGRELKVVRHFTDGIVMSDPVKIIVYDPHQQVVAETDYLRDLLVRRTSARTFAAYGFDLAPLVATTWDFDGSRFVQRDRLAGYRAALGQSLRQRWLGYGIHVLLLVMGVSRYLQDMRAEGRILFVPCFWTWVGLFSIYCLLYFSPQVWYIVLTAAFVASLCLVHAPHEGFLVASFFGFLTLLFLACCYLPSFLPQPDAGRSP